MGHLHVLPDNIANMIAAGEVVQRPASVVKELMENAVDAGATSVSVIISDAGRTLIQVIDNGCGMSQSDSMLCFERHATSKIASAEDLQSILTYGFRGEALASIAAVAEVTLRTRRAEDELASQVVISGGSSPVQSSCSAPVGSNFAVRNLFYNVPARRKFLKSDNVEFKHIVEEFSRVSLTRPDVAFTLIHNGREVYVLKSAKSLKFRVLDLLGSNVVGDVVDIEQDTTAAHIWGFIGRPDAARKTLGNQFFFVNGRFFKSGYMHKAVMKAYEEIIPQGLTPSYFIYFDIDPTAVDVNIHPAKTEIKFEDESVIFQVLYACVKETLGRNSFGAAIDFDTEGMVEMPVISDSFSQYRPISEPSVSFDPDFDPFSSSPVPSSRPYSPAAKDFELSGAGFASSGEGGASFHMADSHYTDKRENYGKLFEEQKSISMQSLVLQDRYILSQAADGIMAVNIQRATERILYEKFIRSLSSDEHLMQASLFPVQVQVGVQNRLLFQEHSAMLRKLGFDIAPFSEDSIVVGGVPEGYSCETGKVEGMIQDLLLILEEDSSSLGQMLNQGIASKLAFLGARSLAPIRDGVQARKLVDQLLSCDNPEFTPAGRRIISLIPMDEIEKRFN